VAAALVVVKVLTLTRLQAVLTLVAVAVERIAARVVLVDLVL
jgi:hypothetical protein